MGKKNQPAESQSKTNGWDALIRLLDLINDQFKTGNFFGLVMLLVFIILFYLAFKMPPEYINNYVISLAKFLRSEKYYIFPLSLTLIISVIANVIQHRTYCAEINRHAELRKQLIHGLKSGELKELQRHSTSEFDLIDNN